MLCPPDTDDRLFALQKSFYIFFVAFFFFHLYALNFELTIDPYMSEDKKFSAN